MLYLEMFKIGGDAPANQEGPEFEGEFCLIFIWMILKMFYDYYAVHSCLSLILSLISFFSAVMEGGFMLWGPVEI